MEKEWKYRLAERTVLYAGVPLAAAAVVGYCGIKAASALTRDGKLEDIDNEVARLEKAEAVGVTQEAKEVVTTYNGVAHHDTKIFTTRELKQDQLAIREQVAHQNDTGPYGGFIGMSIFVAAVGTFAFIRFNNAIEDFINNTADALANKERQVQKFVSNLWAPQKKDAVSAAATQNNKAKTNAYEQ